MDTVRSDPSAVIVIPVARCGESFVCLAGKAADEVWQASAAAETRVQAKAVALAAMQSAWPDLHVELALACTWGEAHTIVVVVSELDASAWVAQSSRHAQPAAGSDQRARRHLVQPRGGWPPLRVGRAACSSAAQSGVVREAISAAARGSAQDRCHRPSGSGAERRGSGRQHRAGEQSGSGRISRC